jgi:hypothetical protein
MLTKYPFFIFVRIEIILINFHVRFGFTEFHLYLYTCISMKKTYFRHYSTKIRNKRYRERTTSLWSKILCLKYCFLWKGDGSVKEGNVPEIYNLMLNEWTLTEYTNQQTINVTICLGRTSCFWFGFFCLLFAYFFQAGLELKIFQPQSPKCCFYRCGLPCPVLAEHL